MTDQRSEGLTATTTPATPMAISATTTMEEGGKVGSIDAARWTKRKTIWSPRSTDFQRILEHPKASTFEITALVRDADRAKLLD